MTTCVNFYKDEFDVYIGRAGHNQDGYFGNPISLTNENERPKCVSEYKTYFYDRIANDSEFKSRIEALRNKRIACFCAPKLCHGMIIVEYLENISPNEQIKTYIKERTKPSIFD